MKKKWILIAALCLLAVVIVVGVLLLRRSTDSPIAVKEPVYLYSGSLNPTKDNILMTAHRGLSGIAPENSVPAVELAGKALFYAAEFDIRLTQDGKWVVMHDGSLNRMTNGKGNVADFTYEQLQNWTLDNGANIQKYPNLAIPTLDRMLAACVNASVIPMVELKVDGEISREALEALNDSLARYGVDDTSILISFNHAVLKQLYSQNPEGSYWYLVSVLDDAQLEICKSTPGFRVAFNANEPLNTKESIEAFAAAGLEFACWTVDDLETLEALYRTHGIRFFTSNRICPALVQEADSTNEK